MGPIDALFVSEIFWTTFPYQGPIDALTGIALGDPNTPFRSRTMGPTNALFNWTPGRGRVAGRRRASADSYMYIRLY